MLNFNILLGANMNLVDNSDHYITQQRILIAVDCIIFGYTSNKLKLLLFKRKLKPAINQWSLIGAFIKNDQSLHDSAKQILLETTGLSDIYLEQLKTYGDVYRDPAGRVISTSYYSLTRLNEFQEQTVQNFDAEWFDIENLPDLIFDHNDMVKDAIEQLQLKAKTKPIGFNLLPELFTIPDLQLLYESIYRRTLDPRNFRKKILSLNILTKTDKKDKSGSKKGAFLYRFNKENFDQLLADGLNFVI